MMPASALAFVSPCREPDDAARVLKQHSTTGDGHELRENLAQPGIRHRVTRDRGGLRFHHGISARHQRLGALKTCPRRETAFMSTQACISLASANSDEARSVMRASSVT